jgi:hypothetical protein
VFACQAPVEFVIVEDCFYHLTAHGPTQGRGL